MMRISQAQTNDASNLIDLGYKEWVCSNGNLYWLHTENPSELKKLLQRRFGLPVKETKERAV